MNTLIKVLMTVALFSSVGTTAWAQTESDDECINVRVNCAVSPADPICTVQRKFRLPQTGWCDKATALALIGGREYERYLSYQGVFPTQAEQTAFAICSQTGPRRRGGKCGWYRAAPCPDGHCPDLLLVISREGTPEHPEAVSAAPKGSGGGKVVKVLASTGAGCAVGLSLGAAVAPTVLKGFAFGGPIGAGVGLVGGLIWIAASD